MAELVAVLALLVSAITLVVLLHAVRSFGSYTARRDQADAGVRQSNEYTRQYVVRAQDEIRANTDIQTQAHERNLILFREMAKFRHELKGLIDNHSTKSA